MTEDSRLSKEDQQRIVKKVSDLIFDNEKSWEDLEIAVRSLHLVLSGITGIKGAIRERSEGFETQLPSGLALSPGYAADCTLDTKRTVKYIRSLDIAVRRMQKKFPGEPINVLYAGTGPFAPFAIPLTNRYSPEELKFTALDIHKESIDALQNAITYLGIEDYFRELIQCDATEYKHSAAGYPLHIMITETMHRAVSREPHALITINLARQLVKEGIIIPEYVAIQGVLSNQDKELQYLKDEITGDEIDDIRIDIGLLFELAKDKEYKVNEDGKTIQGPVVTIPDNIGDRDLLVLLTRVCFIDDLVLKERESGITHPYFVRELGIIKSGEVIAFYYNLIQYPKMMYEKVDTGPDLLTELLRL